jgi:SynChlorMet cassette protein ScmD
MNININSKIIANANYVFREEYDDWALLFNPESSETFGMNQISAFIYKHLNGELSIYHIVSKLRSECKNTPANADTIVLEFVKSLVAKGLAEERESS